MKYRAMLRLFRNTRGQMYGFGYRSAMGAVALGRIVLLGVIFPFKGMLWDKESLAFALAKWRAVFKWAIGRQDMALDSQ